MDTEQIEVVHRVAAEDETVVDKVPFRQLRGSADVGTVMQESITLSYWVHCVARND